MRANSPIFWAGWTAFGLAGCGSATGLDVVPGEVAHAKPIPGSTVRDVADAQASDQVPDAGHPCGAVCPREYAIEAFGAAEKNTNASVEARGLAVFPDGVVYLTGWFSGTVAFDKHELTSIAPHHDGFLTKIEPEGRVDWINRYGDGDDVDLTGVAVDPGGDIGLTGSFLGSLSFGGGLMKSGGGSDACVAHLDRSGRYIDSQRFGDEHDQHGTAVAVTTFNEIVAVGDFVGDLDPRVMVPSAGGVDGYVMKLSSGGDRLLRKTFGDLADQFVTAVAVDPNGGIAIAGRFRGKIDFGLGELVSAGEEDIFVASFDRAGKVSFNRRFGGSADDEALGVAVDAATGQIAVTGFVTDAVNFGCGPTSHGGARDVFIAVLERDGSCAYDVGLGDASNQVGHAVSFDPSHAVVVVGEFNGSLRPKVPIAIGQSDAFVAKVEPDGSVAWVWVLGGEGVQIANAVGTDAFGNVVVAGSFSTGIDFGPVHFDSRGQTDAFVAKLSPDGP